MDPELQNHVQRIARYLREGALIPFLGAGVNTCGQGAAEFHLGERLPSGRELAQHLAATAGYPDLNQADLARVAQYFAVTEGDGELYRELRKVFDGLFDPTPLHLLLAHIPQVVRQSPQPVYPLIVTTNYDSVLEQAFELAGEPFDTVIYTRRRGAPQLEHRDPSGAVEVVRSPNKYMRISLQQRPVIVKIHGAIDRHHDYLDDSYVITEDHYIEYLADTDVRKLLPVQLASAIQRSHFLFLGYSLRDWNLRVILHRIWGEQQLEHRSWAVRLDPQPLEVKYWERRNVDILKRDLCSYVQALGDALGLERELVP